MKDIRPIYARPLDIRVERLRIRRIALNRHLPEALWVEEHSHSHSQFLLHLSGSGCQLVRGTRFATESGSLFFLPPRVRHAFLEETGRKPLCLAMDLDIGGGSSPKFVHCALSVQALHEVKRSLSRLTRWKDEKERVDPVDAAGVLQVADILLRSAGLLPRRIEAGGEPLLRRVQRRLADTENREISLAALAGKIGFQPDYLNRQLKEACGLTLGQLRAQQRLAESRRLLAERISIADTATRLGFEDPNYFSRWFRKLSGQTPSAYRQQVESDGKGA